MLLPTEASACLRLFTGAVPIPVFPGVSVAGCALARREPAGELCSVQPQREVPAHWHAEQLHPPLGLPKLETPEGAPSALKSSVSRPVLPRRPICCSRNRTLHLHLQLHADLPPRDCSRRRLYWGQVYAGGHQNEKYCIAAAFCVTHPTHKLVVTGSEDKGIFIYDLDSVRGQPALQASLESLQTSPCSCA